MKNPLSGRRTLRVVLLVILALLLLFAGWRLLANSEAQHKTSEIVRGEITTTVNALGILEPVTAVDVGAQASGQIVKLLVAPGDVVEKGQLLVEIDPSILQATVDAGRAEIAGLRADLADQQAQAVLARQQYARQRQMDGEGATRAEDVQSAAANLQSAQARVARLRANIEQTTSGLRGNEALLGFTRIYAPIAGTVLSVEAKQGQTLNATYETPKILSIADMSRMTVKAAVAEADIRQIRPGMRASFTTLGDESRRWEGAVRQVLPAPPKSGKAETQGEAASGEIVRYTVLFDVDNRDRALLPGMTAQIAFTPRTAGKVLLVPVTALATVDGRPGHHKVLVFQDGRPVEREVRIGRRDRTNAEVLSGLGEGDRIVAVKPEQP